MDGGYSFVYNGISSDSFDLYYVPDAASRFDDDAEYEVNALDMSHHDGGYYYESILKNRQIDLKCYFEEISDATLAQIRQWLGRNTSGQLWFEDKPFVYYNVHPSAKLDGEKYTHYTTMAGDHVNSGQLNVHFTAYEPCGYLRYKMLDEATAGDSSWMYAPLILQSEMPSAPTLPRPNSFIIYNPGTEAVNLNLKIGGTMEPASTTEVVSTLTLHNLANDSKCGLIALPNPDVGAYLEIDGENAMVYQRGYDDQPLFELHNDGYILLEPGEIYNTDITLQTTADSATATVIKGAVSKADINRKYVFYQNQWRRIINVSADGTTITTHSVFNTSGTIKAKLRVANWISLYGSDNRPLSEHTEITLNRLETDFVPRIQ